MEKIGSQYNESLARVITQRRQTRKNLRDSQSGEDVLSAQDENNDQKPKRTTEIIQKLKKKSRFKTHQRLRTIRVIESKDSIENLLDKSSIANARSGCTKGTIDSQESGESSKLQFSYSSSMEPNSLTEEGDNSLVKIVSSAKHEEVPKSEQETSTTMHGEKETTGYSNHLLVDDFLLFSKVEKKTNTQPEKEFTISFNNSLASSKIENNTNAMVQEKSENLLKEGYFRKYRMDSLDSHIINRTPHGPANTVSIINLTRDHLNAKGSWTDCEDEFTERENLFQAAPCDHVQVEEAPRKPEDHPSVVDDSLLQSSSSEESNDSLFDMDSHSKLDAESTEERKPANIPCNNSIVKTYRQPMTPGYGHPITRIRQMPRTSQKPKPGFDTGITPRARGSQQRSTLIEQPTEAPREENHFQEMDPLMEQIPRPEPPKSVLKGDKKRLIIQWTIGQLHGMMLNDNEKNKAAFRNFKAVLEVSAKPYMKQILTKRSTKSFLTLSKPEKLDGRFFWAPLDGDLNDGCISFEIDPEHVNTNRKVDLNVKFYLEGVSEQVLLSNCSIDIDLSCPKQASKRSTKMRPGQKKLLFLRKSKVKVDGVSIKVDELYLDSFLKVSELLGTKSKQDTAEAFLESNLTHNEVDLSVYEPPNINNPLEKWAMEYPKLSHEMNDTRNNTKAGSKIAVTNNIIVEGQSNSPGFEVVLENSSAPTLAIVENDTQTTTFQDNENQRMARMIHSFAKRLQVQPEELIA